MNTKHIIAATATLLATALGTTGALAQEATAVDMAPKTVSSLTRQAVHQEAVTALAQGRILYGEATILRTTPPVDAMPRTRAQVAAEAREATRLGLVPYGEAQVRA